MKLAQVRLAQRNRTHVIHHYLPSASHHRTSPKDKHLAPHTDEILNALDDLNFKEAVIIAPVKKIYPIAKSETVMARMNSNCHKAGAIAQRISHHGFRRIVTLIGEA